jgi:hypothetical protein
MIGYNLNAAISTIAQLIAPIHHNYDNMLAVILFPKRH